MDSSLTVDRVSAPSDFLLIEQLVGLARLNRESWASSWTPEMLRDEFAKAQVYVARDLGVFSGFLMIRPPGAAWEITLIAVHPAFRGRGVVEALVAALTVSSAAGSSAAEIQLEVRADNEFAIRAYERMGFRAVGRRRGYYQDGVDAVLYSRN